MDLRAAVTLRELTPGDTSLIPSMEALVGRAMMHPWGAQSLGECLQPGYLTCALLRAAGLLGVAVAYRQAVSTDLLLLCVDSAWQGRGLGRQLLSFTLRRCAAGGARECFLEVRAGNARALSLYRRAGFVQVGVRPRYYPAADGLPAEDALTLRLTDLMTAADAVDNVTGRR